MSAWKTMEPRHMTDLERCIREGISLTELRRRRKEAVQQMVEPAMAAFRKALAEHLIKRGPKVQ